MQTNRLQEYRSKAKETQRQVAAAMGIKTIGGYCKKELGYHPVTLEEARRAALHFSEKLETHISIEDIFFDEEVSSPSTPRLV